MCNAETQIFDYTNSNIVTITMNNQQIVINKSVLERINNLTHITNIILSEVKANDAIKLELERNIERKLNYIKEDLKNVDYSIQWAKAKIVNSFILSNEEINVIKEKLERQKMPYINVIEAIEFSDVKIASNLSSIIYIVKVPITSEENCKSLIIKPVKQDNKVIKLENKNLIVCQKNIYNIKNSCKNLNDVSICKQENIEEVTQSSCIPNLLKGYSANCTTINGHHIPTIEEINHGLILINSYNGTIEVDQDIINLHGTFLIKYDNATVTVNGKSYINKSQFFAKPLPAVVNSANTTANLEEVLSLQYLKELNVANIREINAINTKHKISVFTESVIIILLVAMVLTMALKRIIANRKGKIHIQVETKNVQNNSPIPMETSSPAIVHISETSIEDAACFKGGGVNTVYAEIPFPQSTLA